MLKEKTAENEFIKIKHHGKIYTPDYLVNIILNQGEYITGKINKKHVIDNSCGDGQFIIHVIDRYCKDFLVNSQNKKLLKKELETYIHAIEIDEKELAICIERCNKVADLYGISDVKWDFLNKNTLSIKNFNNKMDFVVGNPPYVRVHNLLDNFDSVKNFSFATKGMTDLFIVFYEIGIKMLNQNGKLAYITPSSFFTSVAGQKLRNYLIDNNIVTSICDLKHFQAFNATTYTTIVCLNKQNKTPVLKYYEFDENKLTPKFIDDLKKEDFFIDGKFYFSNKNDLNKLRNIIENNEELDIDVKNGYATLADSIFIKDFDFKSKYIIPVIKASRAKKSQIFYPYDKKGQLIPEDSIKQDKKLFEYLKQNKDKLMNRSNEQKANWYAFGRSQALKDTYREKIAINTLIKNNTKLKITNAPSGTGVYSGLYIISNKYEPELIKTKLLEKDFFTYISMLGKYKSGGYYTFSAKDIKMYLNYKLKTSFLTSPDMT